MKAPAPASGLARAPRRPALRRLLRAGLATLALAALHEALARGLDRPDALPRLLSFDGTPGAWLALALALALFAARLLLFVAAPPLLAALAALAAGEALGRARDPAPRG